MSRKFLAPGALALALFAAPPASAASDADLAQIRDQIRQLKENYEARIQSLEARLKDAEARSRRKPAASAALPRPRGAAAARLRRAVSPRSTRRSRRCCRASTPTCRRTPKSTRSAALRAGGDIGPGQARLFARRIGARDLRQCRRQVRRQPDRLADAGEHGLGRRGLRHSAPRCPMGSTPKFGRFFSGLGYINEQHQHVWDFIDAPLAYQAFLGGQYDNDGVQLKWVAPTDQFLEFGAEVGNGAGFPGTERNKNGVGSGVVYAHTGGDIGASHSWRAGLSYLQTRAQRPRIRADRHCRQRRAARLQRHQPRRDRRLRLEIRAQRQRAGHQLQAAGRILLAARARRS